MISCNFVLPSRQEKSMQKTRERAKLHKRKSKNEQLHRCMQGKNRKAPLVWNTTKTRYMPVKLDRKLPAFPETRFPETPRKRGTRLENEISRSFGNKFPPPLTCTVAHRSLSVPKSHNFCDYDLNRGQKSTRISSCLRTTAKSGILRILTVFPLFSLLFWKKKVSRTRSILITQKCCDLSRYCVCDLSCWKSLWL